METLNETPQDDILAFQTEKVDRSSPLLIEGVYDLEIKSIERKTNEKSGKESLHIKLATTKDGSTTDGGVLHSGWPITHYIGLTPSDKRTVKAIQKDCAMFLDGVYGKGTSVPMQPLDAHVGKLVTVKLKIEEGDENFGASNRVKTFVPPAK